MPRKNLKSSNKENITDKSINKIDKFFGQVQITSIDKALVSDCSADPSIEINHSSVEKLSLNNNEKESNENMPPISNNPPAIQTSASNDIIIEENEDILVPNQPIIEFPLNKHKRRFNQQWYKEYPWILYDVTSDSVFCYCCRKYCKCTGYFITIGFSNWSNGKARLGNHEIVEDHKHSLEAWHRAREKKKTVVEMIRVQDDQVTIDNRNNTRKIFNVIKYLAKQGISFRGHDESVD
jgi:hypothetical protein